MKKIYTILISLIFVLTAFGQSQKTIISHFENISLETDTFRNGSDGSGGFASGLAYLPNNYNASWGTWSGWAYSNMANDTTPGFMNQYSAITAAGMDTSKGDENYAVSYASPDSRIKFTDSSSHQVKGMYVTNSTYAALSMKYGDAIAKKFGGESGDDPDWFKLSVWGLKDSTETDTIEFYLADFRFDDNSKDYIVETWQWLDLNSLGKVDSLLFALSSSDVGEWGMNTPAYFCMDNLEVLSGAPIVANPLANISTSSTADNRSIDLSSVFTDPDDENNFSYEIVANSDSSVAIASIDQQKLEIEFLAEGQTNLVIQGNNTGQSAKDTLVVGVYPEIESNYFIADFEENELDANSYWNGSDESGGFASGLAYLPNNYNASWGTWSGWAYSNMANDTTPGFMNQYSAITAAGMDTSKGDENYAVSYASPDSRIKFTDSSSHQVKGLYVTNSTYAALSMKYGDAFTKQFGGENGNDPDWFKLSVWGLKDSTETDTIEFYLADYRFDDNSKDYIVETWQWLELSSLGKVDSLMFALSSSDVGDFGMNTPAYFCIDNMMMVNEAPFVANPLADISIDENATDTTIDLSDLFSDPDNDDTAIAKTVKSNSNTELVNAGISGNDLSLSYTANANGEAEIVIEAESDGMTVTDTLMVIIRETTKIINPINESVSLSVYPNPTKGEFRINSQDNQSMNIEVYNLMGNLIYKNPNYRTGQVVDINKQPAGNYIIKIKIKNQTYSKSIIKQ